MHACMPRTIQIRDLDDAVYAALVRRVAEVGLTAPDLLRREAARLASRPTMEQWLARTRRRPAARQAVEDLRDWPAERFGHRSLLERAWELRDTVRTWDAIYVALAEALDGTLLTLDGRLARVPGLPCRVEFLSQ